jgi:hypothetical protein
MRRRTGAIEKAEARELFRVEFLLRLLISGSGPLQLIDAAG